MLLRDPSFNDRANHAALETGLKANANEGSPLCDRMTDVFKLDTRIWEAFQLALSHPGAEDVFAMDTAERAPRLLTVSLTAAKENAGHSHTSTKQGG